MKMPKRSVSNGIIGVRPSIVVAMCCGALFMTTLDNTILIIAIPAMQRDLNGTPASLQWTVDSYILARATLLFLGGWLGDRIGRRRCFRIGLCIFILGSLACALGGSFQELIVMRIIQAAGGALMTPAAMGTIVNTFPDRTRRAKAVGFWSATTGVSTAAGPVVGGALVAAFGWRSVFLVNIPVGVIALAGTHLLPETRSDQRQTGFDLLGQFTLMAALGTLIYALISGPAAGWTSTSVLSMLSFSILSWVIFVKAERRVKYPLLRLQYFRQKELSGAIAVAVIMFLALGGFTFVSTIYLQDLRGLSALQAGLIMLPATATTLICAPVSGWITGLRGSRFPSAIACFVTSAALLLMAIFVKPTTPVPLLLAMYGMFGIGIGLVNPPITNAAVSSMPRGVAGVAAATTSTARQVGTSLGVALLGSVVFSASSSLGSDLTTGGARYESMARGVQYAFGVASFLGLAGTLVSLCILAPRYPTRCHHKVTNSPPPVPDQ